MPNILASDFIQNMIDSMSNLYSRGYNERNGGNITYLLTEEELMPYLDTTHCLREIPIAFDASPLAGCFFLVSGSGQYFKNAAKKPDEVLGIVKVASCGTKLELLWGLSGEKETGTPTSELPTHFMSHAARLAVDSSHRVVMHCHATHLIAMSFTHSLDERAFTKTLWEMCTECIVVFPEGIGIPPWIVPGTEEIGRATSEKMAYTRLILWPHHGIYGTGSSFDESLGLIETAEKAAQVYTYVQAQGGKKQTITNKQLIDLAKAFNVTPRAGIL